MKKLPYFHALHIIRQEWRASRAFRWVALGALIYFVLRLAMQAVLLFDPASQEIAADLQIYVNAVRAFQLRQNLYPSGVLEGMNFYQYAPFYALTFQPFLLIEPFAIAMVHTLLHLAAYILLYLAWGRIFARLEMPRAERWLAWTLPVWSVYAAFWGDLAYLNIYMIVALLATLLIEAVMNEQLSWSAFWLVLILQVKPHWAFAALVPLLLGRRAFFLRLAGAALLGYLASILVTVLVSGGYGWQQYQAYVEFLPRLSAAFPWRGPESGFLGYNHSVKQVLVFWLGTGSGVRAVADVLKLLLLLPLAAIALSTTLRPSNRAPWQDGVLFLDLCFALYLGAFIWLDMVWELSLGIVVFVYLLATLAGWVEKSLVWVFFLLYALLDLWQIASYLAFGSQILIQDAYIATDPSIYAPVILFLILIFYVMLVRRLWPVAIQPWRLS